MNLFFIIAHLDGHVTYMHMFHQRNMQLMFHEIKTLPPYRIDFKASKAIG